MLSRIFAYWLIKSQNSIQSIARDQELVKNANICVKLTTAHSEVFQAFVD